MLFSFCYTFLYCNIDSLINHFYLSNFDLNNFAENTMLIQSNKEFYYSLTTINKFILSIYGFYIFYYLFISKLKNIYSLTLSFIYFKYSLNTFLNNNITIYGYEYSRSIMWVFTTPLMLKLYCDANNLELKKIRFLYHYIPCILNVIVYPFKKNMLIYYSHISLSLVLLFLFMKKLISLDKARFTKLFYSIWAMFILLHMIEVTNLINIYTLNTLYLTADMIGKITTTFVMHDNKEYQYILSKNIDLQCINFISYILQKIKKYESKNVNQSKECVR